MKNKISYERYHRQLILKDFGIEGQQKLLDAKVLVVGAGGLGCPALLYLAGAGVGTLGIIDDDLVSLNNLHRQILYGVDDLRQPKANIAAEKLRKLNPEIIIRSYKQRLTVDNAFHILALYDVILDGSDNFATRYLINDAAVLLQKPVVSGAVSQFEGQVAIFNVHQENGPATVNYRDLFPEPPNQDEVPNCAEAGVLGVMPGIIGTLQAAETIKLITGLGDPLINRMVTFNILNHEWFEMEIVPRTETKSLIPSNEGAFRKMNYEFLCGAIQNGLEIDAGKLEELMRANDVAVIDVRELEEEPPFEMPEVIRIPLKSLKQELPEISSPIVVTICQSGKRSLQAARELKEIFGVSKDVFSLEGGVLAWNLRQTNSLI
jgi:sulfur-carrier protein adenylyltransferase/sulfurtransferase